MRRNKILCAYTVVFEPDPDDGGYVVTCPALPGCITEGETLAEARSMAADAIQLYLETTLADGGSPPADVRAPKSSLSETVEVEITIG
jgi:antitoxin HicB